LEENSLLAFSRHVFESGLFHVYSTAEFPAAAVEMLTESFIASTLASGRSSTSAPSALRDVGICLHEFQPHLTPRHSYKKSSTSRNCLAISESHIFAAQAEKAVIHVYNREKGNQEATVPFPEHIHSLAYAGRGSALLVIGTAEGRLILWELASGRQSTSAASHLQAVSSLLVTNNQSFILSGSADSNVHVWSLPNLILFPQASTLSTDHAPTNVPLRTFSNHRSGISALSCGHSSTATNFAVSASDDNTCYIWAIDSCEILRTILLPSTPLCFAVDPADRAIYAGNADGNIHCIDLFRTKSNSATNATDSVHNAIQGGALPLDSTDGWSAASADIGSAQCISLSYDGTMLISGHGSGRILSWDVSKGRVQKSIADLGQSVTNLIMLKPDGLSIERPMFEVPAITKPKIDYSMPVKRGSTGIPAGYILRGQILPHLFPRQASSPFDDQLRQAQFYTALESPFFPQDMVEDAIKNLSATSEVSSGRDAAADRNITKIEKLEQQIAKLNASLQQYAAAAERSRTRRIARMEKREELGLTKRNAYFEANAKGEDGNKAMEEWEEKERQVDATSDDEEMADGLEAIA
jgi:pre-rRNA-processing protein IPI3